MLQRTTKQLSSVAFDEYQFHAKGSKLKDLEGREANVAEHDLVAAGSYMAAAAEWAGTQLGTESVTWTLLMTN